MNEKASGKSYEELVMRVCKNESIVQSLKLNMLRAQSERDLSQKQQVRSVYYLICPIYIFRQESFTLFTGILFYVNISNLSRQSYI